MYKKYNFMLLLVLLLSMYGNTFSYTINAQETRIDAYHCKKYWEVTASGSVKISNSSLTSGLGFTVGQNFTFGTDYSIKGENKKTKQIQYRPLYETRDIYQTQYEKCSGDGINRPARKVGSSTAVVNKPYSVGYRGVYL